MMDAKSLGQVAAEANRSVEWNRAQSLDEFISNRWELTAQAVVDATGIQLEAMREELSATRMQLEAAQAVLAARVDGAYMMGQIS